jgi:hypothetical protein
VEDGVVDAALSRDELSVVDAVFVLEAPLPLDDCQRLFTKGRNTHDSSRYRYDSDLRNKNSIRCQGCVRKDTAPLPIQNGTFIDKDTHNDQPINGRNYPIFPHTDCTLNLQTYYLHYVFDS